MHRRIAGLYLILSLGVITFAQRPEPARTGERGSALRRHVEYLASDKLNGRRTGEPGADAAAEYLAKQFRSLRLKTAGSRNFFQTFPYVTGVALAPSGNEFRSKVSDRGPGGPASAKPVGFSPNASIADAPIVFAGFGIVSAEPKRDDYAGVDAKGNFVLIFDGNPDNDNPHNLLARFDTRTKALIARDKGAVGVLVVTREPNIENDKLARLAFDQTLGEAALPVMVVARQTAAKILSISEGELAEIEAGRRQRDAATPAIAQLKVNLIKTETDARNVIGVLPGTDPELRKEAIIIGAHYDHLGRGGQGSLDINSTSVHRGADDNASGVAAVLELARQFAQDKKNKRTIIFMAFSGEEEGLLGSKYYVNNPIWPLDKTVAMINLDMVGRLKDEKLTVGGIGTTSEWKTIVEAKNPRITRELQAGANPGLALTPMFRLQLNEDGYGPSDHSSFYGKKIPVLFFFTGTHVDYHKPSDAAERVNFDGLENIVSYVGEIVRTIDQKKERPTYTVAKSSGMGGGRTGFNISLGTIPSYADSTDGLVLDGVRENSPAARAGIKPGDKIIKLAGKDVRNAMDYTYVLGDMKAGVEYEVVVLRGSETLTLKVTPVKR